jgi:acyl-CoA thioesterase FadM
MTNSPFTSSPSEWEHVHYLTIEVFKEGRNCISGKVIVVFVGKDGRPIPIPDQIRKALAAENG